MAEGAGNIALRGVTADGKRLALNRGNDIVIWDLEADKEVGKLAGAARGGPLAFSPDGRLCATHSRTGPVRVWDVGTCKEVVHFDLVNRIGDLGTRGASAVVFSPDGRGLLTVDIQVRLWEIATARERWHLDQSLSNFPITGAFSRDGKVVALGTGDGEVRLLETYTGRQLGEHAGHRARVTALAFSPDGDRLASGSADTTALVWDVKELAAKARPAPAEVKADELPVLWKALADADPAAAYKAAWRLEASPERSIPFVKDHLHAAADPEAVGRLIRDLDADDFDAREKAQKELAGLREGALGALREALKKGPGVEGRRRIERLLERYDESVIDMEEVRELRLLEVLEHLGSKEAVQVLEALSRGAPKVRLTEEAKAALGRLRPAQ